MTSRSHTQNAREFVIWRELRACDGDCSLTELAGAVGMPRSTVGSILRRKGWRIASAGASGSGRAQGVDTEIQQNWRN